MTLPTLFLAFILATLMGAGFHLWQGGGVGRLLLYLGAAWLGFALGHLLGEWLGWHWFAIGPLNTLMAVGAATLALGVARWLAAPLGAELERAKRLAKSPNQTEK